MASEKKNPVVMYTHWMSPPTVAVAMICEAANIPLEYKMLDVLHQENMSENFLKINPDHTVPTIDDNGFILWESHSIARYLMTKFAHDHPMYPADLQKRATIDRMLDFELCTIQTAMMNFVKPVLFYDQTASPSSIEAVLQRLNDQIFAGNKFAVGDDLTIADIFIMMSMIGCDLAGYRIQPDTYPHLIEWMKRIKAQDFYKKLIPLYKQAKQQFKEESGKDFIIV